MTGVGMKKSFRYKIVAGFLAIAVAVPVWVTTAGATTINDATNKKNQAQQNLNNANNTINNLTNQKDTAKKNLESITQQIVEIMTSIDILQEDLNKKEKEVKEIQADLAVAKENEANQYSAMKLRIKHMYEKGDTSYLTAFLESKSLADLVNRVEYASSMYDYDKNILNRYKEVKEQTELLEQQALAEKAELEGMQYEYTLQKQSLQSLEAELKKKVSDYDKQLATAKQQAAAYRQEIERQNAIIRDAQNQQGGNSSSSGGSTGSAGNVTGASYNAELGAQIVAYAKQFIGNPYVWGGNSLTDGIDCSGFTQQVYGHFGFRLDRWSGHQRYNGTGISYAEIQPGDLIYYSGHVAIYAGNGQIVHASNPNPYPAGGIKMGSATYTTILAVRRFAL